MTDSTPAAPALLAPGWLDRVCIRPLTRDDLPALEWEGEYRRFRRVYQDVYHRVEKGLAVMWGAELPAQGLIGQVFVQFKAKGRKDLADGRCQAYVHSFRVRSPYRCAGLGTRLMGVVEEDLCRRGFALVALNVGRANTGARRLYERLGYVVVAPDPGRWSYYDHVGMLRHVNEPGWRMQKQLCHPD